MTTKQTTGESGDREGSISATVAQAGYAEKSSQVAHQLTPAQARAIYDELAGWDTEDPEDRRYLAGLDLDMPNLAAGLRVLREIAEGPPADPMRDVEVLVLTRRLELARTELSNIANARRFDRESFDDDHSFADWAQSRARYTLQLTSSEGSGK